MKLFFEDEDAADNFMGANEKLADRELGLLLRHRIGEAIKDTLGFEVPFVVLAPLFGTPSAADDGQLGCSVAGVVTLGNIHMPHIVKLAASVAVGGIDPDRVETITETDTAGAFGQTH